MRKPRDFDSELKALADKAKHLKERRVRDLGALVTATGADALDADVLAGALLDAATNIHTIKLFQLSTPHGDRNAGKRGRSTVNTVEGKSLILQSS